MPTSRSSLAANIIAAVSATAAVFALIVSCQANALAQRAFDRDKKPEGAILAPTTLAGDLCNRVSGYAAFLPANSTLWVVNMTADSPRQFPTEVLSGGKETDQESAAATAALAEATPWVAGVQIGDDGLNQPAIRYILSLYWADPTQSKFLRDNKEKPGFVLPSEISRQSLGKEVRLEQPQHPSIPGFTCDLAQAR